MSRTFRPVKETWYECSDQFVEHDQLLEVLEYVATKVNSQYQTDEYGELTSVWIDDGNAFLAYIREGFTVEDFFDSLGEAASNYAAADVVALFGNLQNMAGLWGQAVDGFGALRFYVD